MSAWKLPSVHSLWRGFLGVVNRFPLQLLAALVAVIAWCLLINHTEKSFFSEEQLIRLLLVCNLVLTLLLAADLFAEVKGYQSGRKWVLRLLALLLCTFLYVLLRPAWYEADIYRAGFFIVAFHLLVSFAPFIGQGTLNGFWQYNKILFLRFLTAALYAAVLFAGLSVALLAIDGLFNADIGWQIYMRLFAIITAGFCTVFFLAGIPWQVGTLDEEQGYSKGLKVFTQYVLIPLMTIYLAILLVYEVKIIISWELPKGMVSTLILGYAFFGILSLLLVYPIRGKEENSWIRLFSRFFYVMMLPLVILLLLAVWKRVSNYGITEPRYILIVLALWLTFITLYFLFSKKQDIRIIPVSLCMVALFPVYGPQSAFSVAERSQIKRLHRLMAATDSNDIAQRGPVMEYLVERHGLRSLQPFTEADLKALEQQIEKEPGTVPPSRYTIRRKKTDTAYKLLQIEKWYGEKRKQVTFVPQGNVGILPVQGYDYAVRLESYAQRKEVDLDGRSLIITAVKDSRDLDVHFGDEYARLPVADLISTAKALYRDGKALQQGGKDTCYLTPRQFSVSAELRQLGLTFTATALIVSLSTDTVSDRGRWDHYEAYLLIRKKSVQ